ncbi:mechanosensitive ion channel family protein [Desulfurispirillum indicum]|uniref:MscS Mechanosensitive ion channel n=1 Tax=Desulfurispirillum indicum (strain ATCC BAA-1389 / DSM 22839 / S5) TaxID=653733 RepID=E6W6Y6_DESIS|nr:mechanosensitive ion channel family protein [Desulfurispirillum indicum]ADU66229.1 MscS Mechanosensitive ion channel [Desulfurispirillum indicum S5]UCZ55563.1 mechanosensitive ion channel family protein [Desulfurispirillum indicum]
MEWEKLLHADLLLHLLRASLYLLAGFVVARIVSRLMGKVASRKLDSHQVLILGKVIRYAILLLFFISALNELGFSLSILLGAAGILTVAIGFASQTSASNLISGLFLLGERPFSVGDVVKIGGTTGEVIAIDLLSVKMRTFDNLYVRIPNESILKSEVTTLTKFPIRRMEIAVGVAYKEDLRRVKEILLAVANANPNCLDEPAPVFIITGFGSSSMDILFCVWARREIFLDARNALYEEIKEAFDRNGIEIPFPHLSLYTGEVTRPFPVTLDQGRTD